MKRALECSMSGDGRFSSLYAQVLANNRVDTIANHVENSKVYETIPGAKEKQLVYLRINGILYDKKYLPEWFLLLWMKYLDKNPDLVAYARNFDTYCDSIREMEPFCQATAIRKYLHDGKNAILAECEELLDLLRIPSIFNKA